MWYSWREEIYLQVLIVRTKERNKFGCCLQRRRNSCENETCIVSNTFSFSPRIRIDCRISISCSHFVCQSSSPVMRKTFTAQIVCHLQEFVSLNAQVDELNIWLFSQAFIILQFIARNGHSALSSRCKATGAIFSTRRESKARNTKLVTWIFAPKKFTRFSAASQEIAAFFLKHTLVNSLSSSVFCRQSDNGHLSFGDKCVWHQKENLCPQSVSCCSHNFSCFKQNSVSRLNLIKARAIVIHFYAANAHWLDMK